MRRVVAIIAIMAGGLMSSAVPAASLDGSRPILCALTSIMECSGQAPCERSTAEATGVPPFVRVNVQGRQLVSADGGRTSPIADFKRVDGRLMLQGMQDQRVWALVIDETTGQMSATVAEADGAIVLSGACIVP